MLTNVNRLKSYSLVQDLTLITLILHLPFKSKMETEETSPEQSGVGQGVRRKSRSLLMILSFLNRLQQVGW